MSEIIGGGAAKILYTLKTVRRIGLKNSAKALSAHNACKACGLGMGGQRGGMTNEVGDFPAVCNKSIQAQSTDIQPPIPNEVFKHSLDDFKQLSGYQLEHMGRLNTPLYKKADEQCYRPISWQEAIELAAKKFKQTSPDKSFFYSSGRSSNEAGFILQLMARLYGTNNVNNCSYYCHQATGVGLGSTIGSGTATVELADISQCDLFFLIGANPASNHPRLIHQLKALRDRGGDVVVINPAKEPGLVKFAVPKSPKSLITGGDYIASYYLQPKIGSDLWVLKGIAKAVLENGKEDRQFINANTEAFDSFEKEIESLNWSNIEQHTGLARAELQQVANCYGASANTIFAWGMGITHHQHGSENVEAIADVALMRGMVGKLGAGLLPLRGHSNVQGIGTVGVKPVLAGDVLQALEKQLNVVLPKESGLDTLACLQAASDGDMDAALLMGGNLYGASPDSQWVQRALDQIGFKLYLTTTLNKGHFYGMESSEALILPVAARDEEPQSTTQESMFNYVRMSDGGIERLDNVRAESEILCELAASLVDKDVLDFSAFNRHKDIRQVIASCVPGMEALQQIDEVQQEFHVTSRILHSPSFFTPSGKARFISHSFNTPNVEESTSVNFKADFMLSTIRSEGQFNTIIYEEADSYRGVESRWVVLMNKEDMDSQGVKEGEVVDLKSDYGEMKAVQIKAFDLPKGNLMAYYPEANILVGRASDPRSKTPAFKSVPVNLHLHRS